MDKNTGSRKGTAKTKPAKQPTKRSMKHEGARPRIEHERGEEALRASEEKYRQLFELESDALFLFDKETTMIEAANRAAVLLYGYTRDEFLKMNAIKLSAEPDKTRQTISDTSGIVPIRYHRKKDGTVFPVEITFNDFVHFGRPMRIAAVRDITKRMRIEEELMVHREYLEELVQERTRALEAEIAERKQAEYDLLEANRALTALHETLREQAARDALTGLHNRRYLYETIERELARAKREGYPVSVVMIDIDHFKEFNDIHGHQAGDEVLVALGKFLQNSTRQGDVACRYGGEEFILVMPGAKMEDAVRRAEVICRGFYDMRIQFDGGYLSSTVSVGVALYPEHGEDVNHIIKAADLALYRAKQDGRNCVRSARAVDS